MGIIGLNTVGLDGGVIIKKGGGGGGVRINNQDKVVDITENGTTDTSSQDNSPFSSFSRSLFVYRLTMFNLLLICLI